MKHVLKADTRPFVAVWDGRKKAEIRLNDRDYKPGHILEVFEMVGELPTGRYFIGTISHIQGGYELPSSVVVLSLGYVSLGKCKRVSARDRLGIPHNHTPAQAELPYSETCLA